MPSFILAVGALHDLQTVYLSTISYSTVGFDDEGLRHNWQLVVAIEGINGVIPVGLVDRFLRDGDHAAGTGATVNNSAATSRGRPLHLFGL